MQGEIVETLWWLQGTMNKEKLPFIYTPADIMATAYHFVPAFFPTACWFPEKRKHFHDLRGVQNEQECKEGIPHSFIILLVCQVLFLILNSF